MPATQVKLNQLKQALATTGQVIAWDGTGWAPTTISSGGTSSGTSGTIQYSNGSGGFLGDPSNLFWNSSTKSLQITGTSSAYAGVFSGDGGGINISQATNLTATYTGINISGNNTQNIRAQITNTNNASATSHASLRLGAALGDPYIILSPTANEAGAVIAGIDNSSTGDIFYISRGSDPSTMTGAQFRLDGNTDSVSIRSASDASFFRATGSTATVSGTTTDIIGGTSNINIVNGGITVTTPLFYVGGGATSGTTIAAGNGGTLTLAYSNTASGLSLSDTNASTTILSRDGTKTLEVSNTNIIAKSSTGFGVRNSAGSGTTFFASAAGTFSNTLTFPTTTGVTGQVLTTDGSGILSWSNFGDNASTISPTQLTGDQNNYDPTGFSTASVIRINSDNGMRVITGLAAPTSTTSFREVTFSNIGSFTILFTSEDTDSTAGNRIIIENKILPLFPGDSTTFYYDNTSDRWRVLRSTGLGLGASSRYKVMALTSFDTSNNPGWLNSVVNNGSFSVSQYNTNNELFAVTHAFSTGSTSAASNSAVGTLWAVSKTNLNLSRNGNCVVFKHRLRTGSLLSDATNRYRISAGLFNNSGNGNGGPTSTNSIGIYFSYIDNENSGSWVLRVRNAAGTVADTNSGVAVSASTTYNLEIVLLPDNQVLFYIDDVLRAKVNTATIPSNVYLFPATGIMKLLGTSSRDYLTDTLITQIILR